MKKVSRGQRVITSEGNGSVILWVWDHDFMTIKSILVRLDDGREMVFPALEVSDGLLQE